MHCVVSLWIVFFYLSPPRKLHIITYYYIKVKHYITRAIYVVSHCHFFTHFVVFAAILCFCFITHFMVISFVWFFFQFINVIFILPIDQPLILMLFSLCVHRRVLQERGLMNVGWVLTFTLLIEDLNDHMTVCYVIYLYMLKPHGTIT